MPIIFTNIAIPVFVVIVVALLIVSLSDRDKTWKGPTAVVLALVIMFSPILAMPSLRAAMVTKLAGQSLRLQGEIYDTQGRYILSFRDGSNREWEYILNQPTEFPVRQSYQQMLQEPPGTTFTFRLIYGQPCPVLTS